MSPRTRTSPAGTGNRRTTRAAPSAGPNGSIPPSARVWQKFVDAPAPVGYDPRIVPAWKDGPDSDAFAALRLRPWRLRVMPGTAMLTGQGRVLTWSGPTT